MTINECTGLIIQSAIAVHQSLGPGLLESAYRACLAHELRERGADIETEVPVPVKYRSMLIDAGYRLDLLVNDLVVVELKTVNRLLPVHHAQLLSYLRLTGYSVGLLINFNVYRLKDGIKRMISDR